MCVELACDIPPGVDQKPMAFEERTYDLADLGLPRAPLTAQNKRDAETLAGPLNDMGQKCKQPSEQRFITITNIVQQVIAESLVISPIRARRGPYIKASPEVEVLRATRRVVRIGVKFKTLILAPAGILQPSHSPGHPFDPAVVAAHVRKAVCEPGPERLHS